MADDDLGDFGEFGGFEAAEPVAERQAAAQAQNEASPWATFAAGNAQDRPDLLCAQNRFPTYLDPSDISGASADIGNENHLQIQQAPPNADLLDGALFGENALPRNQVQIPENVADVMLNAGGAPFRQNQNVNGRLPDIGLGINENRLFAQPIMNGPLGPNLPAAAPSLGPEGDVVEEVHPGAPDEIDHREDNADIRPEAEEVVAEEVIPQAEALPAVDITHQRLQEQVDALQARNNSLEEELQQSRDDLSTQRSRLQEVEQRHSETLDEVRRAGHDALSVVVEQYKEQTKTVIMEQQEAAKIQLLESLNGQMKAFQDLLATQRQNHEDELEREREQVKRSTESAVEEACKQEQEKFQVFLKEEQDKWRVDMSKAVEEERAFCQEKIQEAVKAEHDEAKRRLDEARAEYVQLLEEETKNHEAAFARMREEEIEKAKESMSELVKEERERSKACVQEAVEAVKADMRTYFLERHQADSRVRHRHLTSLDLFLESARQQIGLLLESEKADESSNRSVSQEPSGDS